MSLTLIIANKNYSSWSMRPWLVLKYFGIPFVEQRVSLYSAAGKEQIRRLSPTAKVPVLVDGDFVVCDSLAIVEYLAERFAELALWPRQQQARARARCVAAEMHSGFTALRQHMPMNCRATLHDRGRVPECLADIERVTTVWRQCRAAAPDSGPFLFGEFCIADAMFGPVASRFKTYAVPLDETGAAYRDALLDTAAMRAWYADALAETERVPQYD